MPKLIPDLRKSFIDAARNRIMSAEDHDITIRQVASDCGTAVGTVYNYFPSKEYLMAAVMLDDCAMNAVVSQYISSSGIKRNDVFLSLII